MLFFSIPTYSNQLLRSCSARFRRCLRSGGSILPPMSIGRSAPWFVTWWEKYRDRAAGQRIFLEGPKCIGNQFQDITWMIFIWYFSGSTSFYLFWLGIKQNMHGSTSAFHIPHMFRDGCHMFYSTLTSDVYDPYIYIYIFTYIYIYTNMISYDTFQRCSVNRDSSPHHLWGILQICGFPEI